MEFNIWTAGAVGPGSFGYLEGHDEVEPMRAASACPSPANLAYLRIPSTY